MRQISKTPYDISLLSPSDHAGHFGVFMSIILDS